MNQEPVRKFYLREFRAISRSLSDYEDLNLLIHHLTEGIIRTFEVKGCCIMLLDEREKQLFRVSAYGVSDEYLNKGPVVVDNQHSAFVTGEPVYIEDMANDPRVQYPEAARKEGIAAMLSVPIKYRRTVLGIIRIFSATTLRFHDEDVESLRVLAQHLGLVLENNGLSNFVDQIKFAVQNLPLRMLKGM